MNVTKCVECHEEYKIDPPRKVIGCFCGGKTKRVVKRRAPYTLDNDGPTGRPYIYFTASRGCPCEQRPASIPDLRQVQGDGGKR